MLKILGQSGSGSNSSNNSSTTSLDKINNSFHLFYVNNPKLPQKQNQKIANYTAEQIVRLYNNIDTTQGKVIIWADNQGWENLTSHIPFEEVERQNMLIMASLPHAYPVPTSTITCMSFKKLMDSAKIQQTSFIEHKDPSPYFTGKNLKYDISEYNPANQANIAMIQILQQPDLPLKDKENNYALYMEADILEQALNMRGEAGVTSKINLANLAISLVQNREITYQANLGCMLFRADSKKLIAANQEITKSLKKVNTTIVDICYNTIADLNKSPQLIQETLAEYKGFYVQYIKDFLQDFKINTGYNGLSIEQALQKKVVYDTSAYILYERNANSNESYEPTMKEREEREKINKIGKHVFGLEENDEFYKIFKALNQSYINP